MVYLPNERAFFPYLAVLDQVDVRMVKKACVHLRIDELLLTVQDLCIVYDHLAGLCEECESFNSKSMILLRS